jgi:hypothetical protein
MSHSRGSVSIADVFSLRRRILLIVLNIALIGHAAAQDVISVPHLVKFSGNIAAAPAGTVGVIFALYADETGGAPLWQEFQNVTVDGNGHYSAVLGSRSTSGIPVEVFSSNEARWLGVEVQGQAEQARVLLVSVPYAIKASDAETLGGLPPSAFVRASAVPTDGQPVAFVNTTALSAAARNAAAAAISASGASAGNVPVFTDTTGDLGASLIFQNNGNVGIGTATPASVLNAVSGVSDFRWNTGAAALTPTIAVISTAGKAGAILAGTNGTEFTFDSAGWFSISTDSHANFLNNGLGQGSQLFTVLPGGNVGIGTANPAYPLSVNGIIQSSTGFMFPDGTTQTTAATGTAGKITTTTAISAITPGDSSIAVSGSPTAPTVAVAALGITDAKVHDVTVAKVTGAASTLASNLFPLPQTINVGTSAAFALTVEADSTGLSPSALIATTASNDGNANAIYAAANGPSSSASAIFATSNGSGVPIYASATNVTAPVTAIEGDVASTNGVGVQGYSYALSGSTQGVDGVVLSPAGIGVRGYASSPSGATIGVQGKIASTTGAAVFGSGIAQTCNSSGTCTPVSGGIGGQFQTSSGGTILLGQVVNSAFTPTNVFRVDSTGKGFFDGGTQTGGADFAESVAVEGASSAYAPGDLLIVDSDADRHFALAFQPYSTLVAGIYATKPGILATPHAMDDLAGTAGEIPLAMVGIVPCKVTTENGPIHRGDLLVSSSTPGHAMRGTDRTRLVGAVVGKALGSLAQGTGVIQVLVTLQ